MPAASNLQRQTDFKHVNQKSAVQLKMEIILHNVYIYVCIFKENIKVKLIYVVQFSLMVPLYFWHFVRHKALEVA